MGSIPDSVIEEIRQRADIAEIAAEFVELKRAGRSMTACCPFHQEKTPSFHVHQEDGYFKCFGCGKKGDVFALLMELRGWTFPESIEFLASRYGVAIEEQNTNSSRQRDARKKESSDLRKLSAAVANTYESFLWDEKSGRKARGYLKKRGLNASVCRAFRLGYAPPRQDEFLAAVAAQMQDLSSEDLQKGLFSLGIMRQGDSAKGGAYLMFRDRVMFPILRSDGCPIAFGGRILESLEGVPKYINSPESPIYHKRKTVYGISQASAALRVDRTALIVEGYTDVIALHQSGIENVVATCGTAVAQEHAQVLRRVADTAIVIFDGDSAGRSSAARCFERFINSGVELRVLFLAQGDDPDSLVRRIGSEAFMEMVQNDSRSGLSAFLDFSLESGKEDGTVLKAKVAKEVMGLISKVNNPVEQELLTQTVAEHIGVEFQSLNKLLSMVGPANRGSSSTTRRDMSHSSQAQSFDPGPPVFDDADIESYAAHAEFVSLDSESELASIRVGTNNSPRNTSRRSQVIKYLEQLLIAVVCDPRVAKGIAAIPSLLEKANIGEKKHESLQMLFAMVAEDEAPMGLQLSIQAGSVETVLEEWRVALASCGIQEGRILAEALRQSRVGGIRFEELVSAAQSVSEKSSMIEQLQTLRVAEAKAGDVADKLSLAQEKLKARRQMDKLSNVNNEK